MANYYISKTNLYELIRKLLENSTVIAPLKHKDLSHLEIIDAANAVNVDLSGIRTVESYKSELFKLIEKVSKYFGDDERPRGKKLCLLGMRGCDTEALNVIDRVFVEGLPADRHDDLSDPFYAGNRKDVLVIGADCTDSGDTCFCTTVKGKPWPVNYYDINLCPLPDGFVVEAMSENGKKLVDNNPALFAEALPRQIEAKEKNREKVMSIQKEKNRDYPLRLDISLTHKANLKNSKLWKVLTKDCVECSACNFICPTCTCFLLLDQARQKDNERFKVWDACLKASYAKVAGGANPRGKLYERLQNRYHCKFDYSFDRLNRYTCVGCGRCIDGCAGSIDMRKIFVELEKQAPFTAKLE